MVAITLMMNSQSAPESSEFLIHKSIGSRMHPVVILSDSINF